MDSGDMESSELLRERGRIGWVGGDGAHLTQGREEEKRREEKFLNED